MFKCIFSSKKLYGYLCGGLSDIDRLKVEAHLDTCAKCKEKLAQMQMILSTLEKKAPPQPDESFWHDFNVELDRKLNEQLVPPIILKRPLAYRLNPAFAYAVVLIFTLIVTGYLFQPQFKALAIAKEDAALAQEITTLAEISDETILRGEYLDNEIEEIDLINAIEQNTG